MKLSSSSSIDFSNVSSSSWWWTILSLSLAVLFFFFLLDLFCEHAISSSQFESISHMLKELRKGDLRASGGNGVEPADNKDIFLVRHSQSLAQE